MKKEVKLYNLILPPFMLVAFVPWLAAAALIGNFLIDSAVMLVLSLAVFKKLNWNFYRQSIWKVWGFGFLGDVVGALFILAGDFIWGSYSTFHSGENGLVYRIVNGWGRAMYLDGTNALSYVFAGIAVLIAAAVIFLLDRFVAFKNTDLTNKQKTLSALAIAVFTAPYTFFLPYNFFD